VGHGERRQHRLGHRTSHEHGVVDLWWEQVVMENMPYSELHGLEATAAMATTTMSQYTSPELTTSDWTQGLPVLSGTQVVLRELRASDAPSLFALLTTEEVSRFISPPPSTVEGFERFIAWTIRQRMAGSYACFAVTVKGFDTAIGMFQVRALESGFGTAEWGFAIGSPFWGTGVFQDGAQRVVDFAFETLGVHRLEARSAVLNGRGNGALLKIGAVPEGLLRKAFQKNGEYLDQVLYAILEDDWRASLTNIRFSPTTPIH
jgi:ribosomal-protein-alanine N-acetyltransferase